MPWVNWFKFGEDFHSDSRMNWSEFGGQRLPWPWKICFTLLYYFFPNYGNAFTYTHPTVIQMNSGLSNESFSFRTVNSLNRVLTEIECRNNCFIALFEAGPSIRLPVHQECVQCVDGEGIRWRWGSEKPSRCTWSDCSKICIGMHDIFPPLYTETNRTILKELSLNGRDGAIP